MRIVSSTAILAVVLASGCAGNKPAASSDAFAPIAVPGSAAPSAWVTNRNLIVTLEGAFFGKVASVNPARFVVLSFPLGHMPALDQRLSLYRHGLKVGEVKITGPQQDDNTVADLVTGEAEAGDEARDR